ncbi:hypothetical protein [Polycladidibacter hongkongensis]|uniref:hypothetical protein n=1 Tax=Polycladidibacter hongkongensis TaxID=1647556 RepID=UPI0012E3CF25|nr:hypothetical protein [Pseudovibrio hongkongensis]
MMGSEDEGIPVKKERLGTTCLKPSKPLTAKELMRAVGKAGVNRAVGIKGGQQMVKRQ